MSNKVTINNKEYPSLAEGCSAEGINYAYARQLKLKKGNKFRVKVVKYYDFEVKEN